MEKDYLSQAESIANSCVSDFFELFESQDWIPLGTNDGVSGYTQSKGPLELVKAIGIVNFPPPTVAEYLWDLSHKKDWDETLIETKTLYDYGDVRILRETFKAPWPVSNRDFVFVLKRLNRDDDIYYVGRSIDIGVPEQADTVRGECITSGFYLRNIEDIATELIYIVEVDPKGSIPSAIVNFVARQQVSNINKIRAAMIKSNS